MPQTWQATFDEIRPDMKDEELHQQIMLVETAVFSRLQELSKTNDSAAEHFEIAEVMKKVRQLQVERLKYPEFGVHGDVWKFGIPQV